MLRGRTILLALLVLVPFLTVIGIRQTGATNPIREWIERGLIEADGLKDASTEPLFTVDGYPVTEREYRHAVNAVRHNLDYMDDYVAAGEYSADQVGAFAALIRDTGVETVGLGGLISDVATYQWGFTHGYEVSEAEVQARLERDRQLMETVDNPSADARRAFIKTVGADLYWNEMYPRILRRELVVQKVYRAQVRHPVEDSATAKQTWHAFQADLTRNAVIEPVDPAAPDPKAIQRAIDYIAEDSPAFYDTWGWE